MIKSEIWIMKYVPRVQSPLIFFLTKFHLMSILLACKVHHVYILCQPPGQPPSNLHNNKTYRFMCSFDFSGISLFFQQQASLLVSAIFSKDTPCIKEMVIYICPSIYFKLTPPDPALFHNLKTWGANISHCWVLKVF